MRPATLGSQRPSAAVANGYAGLVLCRLYRPVFRELERPSPISQKGPLTIGDGKNSSSPASMMTVGMRRRSTTDIGS